MPTGSNHQTGQMLTKAIVLDGGLDLVTPRLLVEPGKLVDCLNYECVDQVGYKKVDGFERYDGGPSWAVADYWDLFTTSNGGLGTPITAGDEVYIVFTDASGNSRNHQAACLEAYVSSSKWVLRFAPPFHTELLTATAATAYLLADKTAGTPMVAQTSGGVIVVTNASGVATSNSRADDVRAEVDALPGDVPAYGLQFYKDSLYAAADLQYIYVAYDHAQAVGVTSDIEFFVGNNFRINGTGTRTGVILDYRFLFGDFGAPIESGMSAGLDTAAIAKVLVRFTNTEALPGAVTAMSIERVGATVSGSPMDRWLYLPDLTGVHADAVDDEPVWTGGLYKGLTEGAPRTATNDWTAVDMGYEVAFQAGASAIIPKELTLATTTEQLNNEIQTLESSPEALSSSFGQVTMQAYQNSAASFPAATTDGALALTTQDLETADATGVYLTQSVFTWGDGTANSFTGFNFNIPEDVIITGVTLTSKNFFNTNGAGQTIYFHTIKLSSGTKSSFNKGSSLQTLSSTANATSANAKTFTLGGANDKWGMALTPEVVNDDSFTVTMTPTAAASNTAYLFWDQLTVTIHYFRPVGKLFFHDGTTEIEAKLVRIALTKGSWVDADEPAEGIAHIYDPTPSASRNYIKAGENIRLTSGGSTIATVGSVAGSGLPSHAEVVTTDRRVQMLAANFYLNPDWETIYGCSGLDRAFSYDGRYFRKIYTAYDSELDKPRHIHSWRNYLAMGYESGNVLLSKYGESGPEPENFVPLQGAREFSFVDRVVGLQELPDTSLGVFCQDSINRIVLNPNAVDSSSLFYTASISPVTGALEYTVASFGGMTLFCDQYGIRNIEQTDVYGDFIGTPMSSSVSPWLRPRLSTKQYWQGSKTAHKPLFAHAVRSKNQYRIWFDDGYFLCMNMNTMETPPKFTLGRYGFNFGGSFVPLLPVCHSSRLDSTGAERIHVAHWDRSSDVGFYENDSALFKYVFEMEKGWSFDGQDFPARLTINMSFLETPFDYDIIRKVETHFLDYGSSTLFLGAGTKYGEEKSYSGQDFSATYQPAGRNGDGTEAVEEDYIPYAKMVSPAIRGRPVYLKYKNSTTATGGEATSAIEPPHILQALLVQYLPAKTEN